MNTIGNFFWLILGGIVVAILYYLVGLLMCITIVGIPFGVQLFKLGTYACGLLDGRSWTVLGSPDAFRWS